MCGGRIRPPQKTGQPRGIPPLNSPGTPRIPSQNAKIPAETFRVLGATTENAGFSTAYGPPDPSVTPLGGLWSRRNGPAVVLEAPVNPLCAPKHHGMGNMGYRPGGTVLAILRVVQTTTSTTPCRVCGLPLTEETHYKLGGNIHRDCNLAFAKQWREANRDRRNASRRERTKAPPAAHDARLRPELAAMFDEVGITSSRSGDPTLFRLRRAVKQAFSRGREWTITLDQYAAITETLVCHYHGGPFDLAVMGGHGLDRIDNARGYHADNVVLCCYQCNTIKGRRLSYQQMMDKMAPERAKHRAATLARKVNYGVN